MLGRVTQRSIALNSLTNLQNAQARTAKLQEQLSSGKTLSKGSDDSVRAAAALRLNEQVAVNGEHARNVHDARAWMSTQEGALDSVVDALQEARARTVQAGNTASVGPKGLAAIAEQVREVRRSVLAVANTQYQGRAVFAGTSDAAAAYTDADGGYAGSDDGGVVTRTVSPGVHLQVNVSGTGVFGEGEESVFAELDALADRIQAGESGAISAGLATIDGYLDRVTNALALIGARGNQLDQAEDVNNAQQDLLVGQLDEVEGLDMAKALVDLNLQSTAYQAALASTARVIQPTLLDFLR